MPRKATGITPSDQHRITVSTARAHCKSLEVNIVDCLHGIFIATIADSFRSAFGNISSISPINGEIVNVLTHNTWCILTEYDVLVECVITSSRHYQQPQFNHYREQQPSRVCAQLESDSLQGVSDVIIDQTYGRRIVYNCTRSEST